MIQARAVHTATALPDGGVLIAGGFDPAGYPLASAELLAPGSGAVALAKAGRPSRVRPGARGSRGLTCSPG